MSRMTHFYEEDCWNFNDSSCDNGMDLSPVPHSPVKQTLLASQFHKRPARISANYVPRQVPVMNDPRLTQVLSMNSAAKK